MQCMLILKIVFGAGVVVVLVLFCFDIVFDLHQRCWRCSKMAHRTALQTPLHRTAKISKNRTPHRNQNLLHRTAVRTALQTSLLTREASDLASAI